MLGKIVGWTKSHKRIIFLLASLILATVIELFASVSTSPLYGNLYLYDNINIDSNFFMLAGKLITEGKTPYIDFFDHKGLYVFYINALGMSLGIGKYGVFLLQIVWYTFVLYFSFLTVELYQYGCRSYIVMACFYLFAMAFQWSGNHTGEWLLPFVVLSVYYASKAITSKLEVNWVYACFMAGIEAGFALNSRPSDAMWGLALVIAYAIHYFRKRRNIEILFNIISALSGLLLPFAIFIPISIIGGYTSIMFKAVIVENLIYTGGHASDSRWLYRALVLVWILLSSFFTFLRFKKKEDDELTYFLLSNLIVGGIMQFIIARYGNYVISAYPLMSLNVISIFHLIKIKDKSLLDHSNKWNGVFAGAGLAYGIIIMVLFYTIGMADAQYDKEKAIQDEIIRVIPNEYFQKENGVYCLDTNVATYLNNNIKISTKYYTFQSWWASDNEEVVPLTLGYLNKAKPTYIIQRTYTLDDGDYGYYTPEPSFDEFLEANYTVISKEDTPRIRIWEVK